MTSTDRIDYPAQTGREHSEVSTRQESSNLVPTSNRLGWKSILKRGKSRDITRSQTRGCLYALCTVLANVDNIQKASLCNTDVIHSATNLSDLGWGCGYRNIQMLFSSLASLDSKVFEAAFGLPDQMGIVEIQRAIERAWARGFDVEGAQQLSWKLLDTKKWIGTTEAYALLTDAGYDVTIVQFDGTNNGQKLINFCALYFGISEPASTDDSVLQSKKHPLYFQHQGHSRTIIGCVQTQNGLSLLVFDPARRVSEEMKKLAPRPKARTELSRKGIFYSQEGRRTPKWSRLIKAYLVDDAALTKKEYQILRIDGLLDAAGKEQRKIIRPCTIR